MAPAYLALSALLLALAILLELFVRRGLVLFELYDHESVRRADGLRHDVSIVTREREADDAGGSVRREAREGISASIERARRLHLWTIGVAARVEGLF